MLLQNRAVFVWANLLHFLDAMPQSLESLELLTPRHAHGCDCFGPECNCALPIHEQEWRDYQCELRSQFREWLALVRARPTDPELRRTCECIGGVGCNCKDREYKRRRFQ